MQALTPLNDALKRKEMENAMTSAGVASVSNTYTKQIHYFSKL